VVAPDAAGIAEQLAAAERAIIDQRVSGEQLAWYGHLQQVVYRTLVEQATLREAVLELLPAEVAPIARANLEAGLNLRAMVNPGEKLPPWRVVEPASLEELRALYQAAEAEFGVPWQYLAAVHLVETFMGRIRGTSVAGARGPMQFIASTWAIYGEGDIESNRDSIRAAARYLKASGAPGNMAAALYAYNPSQRYVRAVTNYAERMRADQAAFRGYYHWQVYFLTTAGDAHLPVGYYRE
jgi:membrane-bound lytic murein transglycosylase B